MLILLLISQISLASTRVVNHFFAARDSSTLYMSLNELPNPRNWGTLDFAVGNRMLFSEDIYLLAPDSSRVEALIGKYWRDINSSKYKTIAYNNVSNWLQEKIEKKLKGTPVVDQANGVY